MGRRKWNYETIQNALDGENVSIQSGYTPAYKNRKVGDEWEEKGILWKKTAYGVVRVNKQMDAIRELVRASCSVCKMDIALFGDRVDEKIFAKTGKCFACLEIEEQLLKISGKYKEYEHLKIERNRLSALKEFKQKVEESIAFLKIDDCKIQLVTSSGDLVTWMGAQNESILKDAEDDLIKANNEIEKVEKELAEYDKAQIASG